MADRKKLLLILNTIYAILGLGLCAGCVWLYLHVTEITSLENPDQKLQDNNVYWYQAAPWMLFSGGALIVLVSGCGFIGACKGSRCLLTAYVLFLAVSVLLAAVTATAGFMFAVPGVDAELARLVQDVQITAMDAHDVDETFGRIEREYFCCGAHSSADYSVRVDYRRAFPASCCGAEPGAYCAYDDPRVIHKPGCILIVTQFTRRSINMLSGAAAALALAGLGALAAAALQLIYIRKHKRRLKKMNADKAEAKQTFDVSSKLTVQRESDA